MKNIKTPVGYGKYNTTNSLWIFTHKNIIKNNTIKYYNMDYSKYHYLNCIEEEEDEVMKNIYKVASQDLLPIYHINYLEKCIK